jgi:hypothetical protein
MGGGGLVTSPDLVGLRRPNKGASHSARLDCGDDGCGGGSLRTVDDYSEAEVSVEKG